MSIAGWSGELLTGEDAGDPDQDRERCTGWNLRQVARFLLPVGQEGRQEVAFIVEFSGWGLEKDAVHSLDLNLRGRVG